MEKLAKQGIRFSDFYAMSVCSPTRASILNGQTQQLTRPHSLLVLNRKTLGPTGQRLGTGKEYANKTMFYL